MNKFATLGFCLILCVGSAFGQKDNSGKKLKTAIKSYASEYQLDKQQFSELEKLYTGYLDRIEEIESLKDSNPEFYFEKRKSIRNLFDGELKRTLNKRQVEILKKKNKRTGRERTFHCAK